MRHFQIITDHISVLRGGSPRVRACVFPHMEMFGNPSQSIVLCGRESRPAWRSEEAVGRPLEDALLRGH